MWLEVLCVTVGMLDRLIVKGRERVTGYAPRRFRLLLFGELRTALKILRSPPCREKAYQRLRQRRKDSGQSPVYRSS